MVLQIMSDKFPDVQKMNSFIQSLKDMRSYDDMLDQMIIETRMQDISEKDKGNGGLTLNDILNNLDIRKWNDKDEKK